MRQKKTLVKLAAVTVLSAVFGTGMAMADALNPQPLPPGHHGKAKSHMTHHMGHHYKAHHMMMHKPAHHMMKHKPVHHAEKKNDSKAGH